MNKSSFVADLTPLERRKAVAAILAKGLLRCRRMAACSAPQESAPSPQNCLGPAAVSRPCVPAGSGGYTSSRRHFSIFDVAFFLATVFRAAFLARFFLTFSL